MLKVIFRTPVVATGRTKIRTTPLCAHFLNYLPRNTLWHCCRIWRKQISFILLTKPCGEVQSWLVAGQGVTPCARLLCVYTGTHMHMRVAAYIACHNSVPTLPHTYRTMEKAGLSPNAVTYGQCMKVAQSTTEATRYNSVPHQSATCTCCTDILA